MYISEIHNLDSYDSQTLGPIWTNPNVGLKNEIKKCNPMAGFVHILPKVGLKQPCNF